MPVSLQNYMVYFIYYDICMPLFSPKGPKLAHRNIPKFNFLNNTIKEQTSQSTYTQNNPWLIVMAQTVSSMPRATLLVPEDLYF